MSRSSARYVPYDIRPSKQIERRIMLDVLKVGSEAGLKLSTYKYVGFGGFKFYDFEMLFRHLGIKSMVSIEQDADLIPRCQFNKPFDFISIKKMTLGQFIDQTIFKGPLVAWLDYDWGLSQDISLDTLALSGKLPVGSFMFVTVRADVSPEDSVKSADDRIAELKEQLGEFALIEKKEELSTANYPYYVDKVLNNLLSAGLSKRSDGEFLPLFRMIYKDTVEMATVGGCLCPKGTSKRFEKLMKRNFGFLHTDKPYQIPSFNLTSKERHLLDLLVTSNRRRSRARKNLINLGIKGNEIERYKGIVRYIPRYFESYI